MQGCNITQLAIEGLYSSVSLDKTAELKLLYLLSRFHFVPAHIKATPAKVWFIMLFCLPLAHMFYSSIETCVVLYGSISFILACRSQVY